MNKWNVFSAFALWLAALIFCRPAMGVYAYWVGGESGDWGTAANWSCNAVPNTANYLVFVTNETPVTITLSSSKVLCHASFSGADHSIVGSGTMIFRQGNGLRPAGVDVAEGITVTIREAIPYEDKACGFLKTGKGTVVASSYVGSNSKAFSEIEIREGTFYDEYAAANSINAGSITVRTGAALKVGRWGLIADATVVHLEEGAVYDGGGTYDALGGFTGAGTVTNLNRYTESTFSAGPLDFSGRIFGAITLSPTAGRIVGEDGAYFRVGAADTLAEADVHIAGASGYTNILRFAAGVGEFDCGYLQFDNPIPVVLEDAEGAAVYLRTSLADDTCNAYFAGKGGLIKTGDNAYCITGSCYSATGVLEIEGGEVRLGNNVAGNDAVLPEGMAGIQVAKSAVLTVANEDESQTPQSMAITGAGTVSVEGVGEWTVNGLSLTNGTLDVGYPASSVVLGGGVSSDLNYGIEPDTFETVITGGEWRFLSGINFQKLRTFRQSGGTVYGVPQAAAKSDNEIFYTMSGGRLISEPRRNDIWPSGIYPQGIGMDLSGTAHVELRNQESFYHRLCSGSKSHTIRLRDNAYLWVDYLQLGEANSQATAKIELFGGTLEVSNWIGFLSAMSSDASLKAEIVFNGGEVRTAPGVRSRSIGRNDAAESLISGKVRIGGAKMTVPGGRLTFSFPLASDVDSGVDGGLLKMGIGELELKRECTVAGPVRIREGRLMSYAKNRGEIVVGTGDVLLGSGDISMLNGHAVTLCSAEGALFTYTNCASLSLASGTELTIGPAGAAAGSVIRRGGHGVLTVAPNVANKRLGESSSVTVNGGVALDAVTGLPLQPIFERDSNTQSDRIPLRLRFLTCNADGELLPASTVAFEPASSSASTVAEVTASAVTVSEDAAVGALNVEYADGKGGLTIADGVTLSIGSGTAGAVAPLLLNNVKTGGSGYASVSGGTIDFGSAEGVIAVNQAVKSETPSRIDSVIAGSGGVTFAAPALYSSGFRGYISLGKANTYSGGTWVENVLVRISDVEGLGSGEVNVEGLGHDSGSLLLDCSGEFDNKLKLSGYGPEYPDSLGNIPRYGTLTAYKSVKLTGGVELSEVGASLMAGCRSENTVIDVASEVSGAGELKIYGLGTVRLSARNTYSGGTHVVDGVLEVADAGTFGSGPVVLEKSAVLRFVNAAARTVDNVITGEGRIECLGAPVGFRDVSGFNGRFFGGAAAGAGDLVKTGEGTFLLTSSAAHTGNTVVKSGSLVLGEMPSGNCPAEDAVIFRLDASQADSITIGDDGAVLEWNDADGRDIAFTNAATYAPVLQQDMQKGMPAVFFNGTHRRRLISNRDIGGLGTVFFVTRVNTGSHPGAGWSNAGLFGVVGSDCGLRLRTKERFKADSMFTDGLLYANGKLGSFLDTGCDAGFKNGDFGLLQAVPGDIVPSTVLGIGDYWGSTAHVRSYYGHVAEVVAYDRRLDDNERMAMERYLMTKWGIAEVSVPVYTNLLPVATALQVDDGATLDLAGGSHEIASLSGGGTIDNSSPVTATLKLSSGTSVFSGSFEGSVHLEVAAGATLDLCGGTIGVASVGGSGRIVNGTVVVSDGIYPGGKGGVGTLVFGKAPVVSGATLEIEADGEGGVDRIVVEEAFDMTGLKLHLPSYGGFVGDDFEVVRAGGEGLSGTFASHNLKNPDYWKIVYTEKSAYIRHERGFIMILK